MLGDKISPKGGVEIACNNPLVAYQFPNVPKCKPFFSWRPGSQQILLPCGQCAGCRLDYSRKWATRIWAESCCWTDNWFVTLTYDDESIKPLLRYGHMPDTGEVTALYTLDPPIMKKFMKDLREYFRQHFDHVGIRVYYAGEYGDQGLRPHYHMCLFNCPLPADDLTPHSKNELGQWIYESKLLSQIWDKGFVSVGELTWNSAAYVARYVMKKQKGKGKQIYSDLNIHPEFSHQSNRPGIGALYFDIHKDEIYKNDEMFVPQLMSVARLQPPKYFDSLLEREDPDLLQSLKEHRKEVAARSQKLFFVSGSLTPSEKYEVRERSVSDRAKGLVRTLESR